MSANDLKSGIAKLERQFALLEASHSALAEHHDQLLTQCEKRVEVLEARLKDLERIEKLAYEAYIETHESAQDFMLDADRIVPLNISASVYSKNIATAKRRRNRSKS